MHALTLDIGQSGSEAEIAANIRSAVARRLPEIQPALCPHDGTFVLVGSGPSAPRFIEEIRKERELGRPICAIKGAHDLLCENGIEPDLFVSVEPRARTENVKLKNKRTVYLLASRVSPQMFDHLHDCAVVLWHSWSTDEEAKAMPANTDAIGGGSTSGLRAINVGYVLGYRKFILYGFDSCNAPDGSKRFTGEKTGKVVPIYMCAECQDAIQRTEGFDGGHCISHKSPCNLRRFSCNGAMAKQAQNFQLIYAVMPDITVEAKGDGLIAAIIEQRKIRGLHT